MHDRVIAQLVAEVLEHLHPLDRQAILAPGDGSYLVYEVLVRILRALQALAALPGLYLRTELPTKTEQLHTKR